MGEFDLDERMGQVLQEQRKRERFSIATTYVRETLETPALVLAI